MNNKFDDVYKNILAEVSQKDKKFQQEKLEDFITEKYYEIKHNILDEIFSDESAHSAANQLDYLVLNNEMTNKKFGNILYPADNIDNFDDFGFSEEDENRIKEMIYKCLANNFKSIFIDHEDY